MLKDEDRRIVTQEYEDKKLGELIKFTAHLNKIELQEAYFSITGVGRDARTYRESSWGCLHDSLRRIAAQPDASDEIKRLAPHIKWHLCSVRKGPMHYVENSVYHLQQRAQVTGELPSHHRSYMRPDSPKKTAEECFESFKHCCVFGVVDTDETTFPAPPELPREPDKSDVYVYGEKEATKRRERWISQCFAVHEATYTEWLERRFSALMEAFERDMVSFFGEDIRLNNERIVTRCCFTTESRTTSLRRLRLQRR